MYGRIISFTLLAPSLWSVVESIGSKQSSENHKRFLFKSAENAGFIVEIFSEFLKGSKFTIGLPLALRDASGIS